MSFDTAILQLICPDRIGLVSDLAGWVADNGPIIEQTITQVTHHDGINDLIRKGRDTEKLALSRALRLHLTRQVMVYEGRTVSFA